jgi:phage/plasmid-like protein (TIGR03299 family)
MATEGRFTSVRVVCNNTLSMATGGKAKSRVTHRSVFDPTKMKKELGIEAKEQFADFMKSMRDLAAKPLANSEVIEMTAELFHPGSAKKSREDYIQALKTRSVASVLELAIDGSAKGSKLPGVKDTAYGWLNAVTEYIDHHKQARSDDNRRASAWFGPGETLKSRALEMALAA